MAKTAAWVLGVVAALAFPAGPASAQKSADTLRFAITDMPGGLDPYHFPHDEGGSLTRTFYETLVGFDERKRQFVPRLAKAWRRLDQRTLEFDLNENVRFHNGDKFDAEDVKYTIDYVRDPNIRLRFKERYNWIENVEIVNPHRVRITSVRPLATDLQTMAYRLYIVNSKVHKKLENKEDYGRSSPIATGPYKVTAIDPRKGVTFERFAEYYDKSGNYPAPIKKLIGIALPDRQTQLAQFLTGGLDLMRDVPADMAREIAKMPNAAITTTDSGTVVYVTLDAAGRSANKMFTDQRVRRAFMMAVNRRELLDAVVPGGQGKPLLQTICFPSNLNCSSTVEPPPFDPQGAKRLLAEAGHPDGVDLELSVYAPIREIGEAIAGQVRVAGIRASARPLPLSLYARMRGAGELTALVSLYPTSAEPDAHNIFDLFFSGDRDYWRDREIHEAMAAGQSEFDAEKRAAIYAKALDRVNERNYILPVAALPTVWAHTKEVRISDNPLSAAESRLGDWHWN